MPEEWGFLLRAWGSTHSLPGCASPMEPVLHRQGGEPEQEQSLGSEVTPLDSPQGTWGPPGEALVLLVECNIFTAYHCSFQNMSPEGTVLEDSGAEWRRWRKSMPISFVTKNHCKPPASGKITHRVMAGRAWVPSPGASSPHLWHECLDEIPSSPSPSKSTRFWAAKNKCVSSHFRHVQLCVTPWTEAHQAPLSMDSPGKNTGVGCHFLLQGIFPTQLSNPCLLSLLHWQLGSLPLVSTGKPKNEWDFQFQKGPMGILACDQTVLWFQHVLFLWEGFSDDEL